jgi:hypothetical protein
MHLPTLTSRFIGDDDESAGESSVKRAMFGNTASAWASEMKMPSRQTTISVKNAGPIYM